MQTNKGNKMKTKKITSFTQLCRQPTGMHFMDSGGDSGRHWQRKPLKGMVVFNADSDNAGNPEFDAKLNLGEFLDACVEIDQKLTGVLKRSEKDKENSNNAAQYLAEYLTKKTGTTYKAQGWDNSYNHETDLTQDFQFCFVVPEGGDTFYGEDTYICIETHNGADIRGGYSNVIVGKPNGSDGFSNLLDWTVGWYLIEGIDTDGKTIEQDALESLGQEYEQGYSSNPSYSFNESIGVVLDIDLKKQRVKVKLKTGQTVTAVPSVQVE